MKFQTSNGVYSVNWRYTMTSVNAGGKKTAAREKTECVLSKDKQDLCRAIVTRYYKDTFDKKVARKNTLKGVLKVLSKETRAEIWNSYLNNVKK